MHHHLQYRVYCIELCLRVHKYLGLITQTPDGVRSVIYPVDYYPDPATNVPSFHKKIMYITKARYSTISTIF